MKRMTRPALGSVGVMLCAMLVSAGCSRAREATPMGKEFPTPQAAVQALSDAAAARDIDAVLAIFGPDGKALVDTSDPDTALQGRQVFVAAMREGWHLTDDPSTKVLVIGNEQWPFPVPLVNDAGGWRFDTAAGQQELIARRIGRNELTVIRLCRTYVAAQQIYASTAHDGNRPGVFAASFRSSPGKQNGLYWQTRTGEHRSPLGELVEGAEQRSDAAGPATPFHGYYFRILGSQGPSATGGPMDYRTNGQMTGGFALVAWPAYYDASGIMSFIVNRDGVVYEKDLGPGTATAVAGLRSYDPDPSWTKVE
jgi:DUF2950 family protein